MTAVYAPSVSVLSSPACEGKVFPLSVLPPTVRGPSGLGLPVQGTPGLRTLDGDTEVRGGEQVTPPGRGWRPSRGPDTLRAPDARGDFFRSRRPSKGLVEVPVGRRRHFSARTNGRLSRHQDSTVQVQLSEGVGRAEGGETKVDRHRDGVTVCPGLQCGCARRDSLPTPGVGSQERDPNESKRGRRYCRCSTRKGSTNSRRRKTNYGRIRRGDTGVD